MSLDTNARYAGIVLLALDDTDKRQIQLHGTRGVYLALARGHHYFCQFCNGFSSNSESQMAMHTSQCKKAPRPLRKKAVKLLADIEAKTERCYCGRPAYKKGVGICKQHWEEHKLKTELAHQKSDDSAITFKGQGAIQ